MSNTKQQLLDALSETRSKLALLEQVLEKFEELDALEEFSDEQEQQADLLQAYGTKLGVQVTF